MNTTSPESREPSGFLLLIDASECARMLGMGKSHFVNLQKNGRIGPGATNWGVGSCTGETRSKLG